MLFRSQTPQGFHAPLLYQAFERAAVEKFYSTDEAGLVERLGVKVKLVEGDYANIKITTPEDLAIAEMLLSHKAFEPHPSLSSVKFLSFTSYYTVSCILLYAFS